MPTLTSAGLLGLAPVMPVVVLEDADRAIRLAEALVVGGLPVIEVTLRTSAGLRAITAIATRVPDAIIGAGTVNTPVLARQAADAGAQFLISPGCTDKLLDAMNASGLPYLPGVATASEVLRLLERGHPEMKFFPAEASGGHNFLRALASPLPEARFCPTGGITLATAPTYLALPNVGCIGGTWLTPPDAIVDGDWTRIERLARQASNLRGSPTKARRSPRWSLPRRLL
jgi:2-dehydro-3-deoxyphosphogluconate aldolase / (4S)-4-hydroxy-2-oxoglutarate aldolase